MGYLFIFNLKFNLFILINLIYNFYEFEVDECGYL